MYKVGDESETMGSCTSCTIGGIQQLREYTIPIFKATQLTDLILKGNRDQVYSEVPHTD